MPQQHLLPLTKEPGGPGGSGPARRKTSGRKCSTPAQYGRNTWDPAPCAMEDFLSLWVLTRSSSPSSPLGSWEQSRTTLPPHPQCQWGAHTPQWWWGTSPLPCSRGAAHRGLRESLNPHTLCMRSSCPQRVIGGLVEIVNFPPVVRWGSPLLPARLQRRPTKTQA